MLMYGFCMEDIESVRPDCWATLLRIADLYGTAMNDCNNSAQLAEWILNYQSGTYYGLCALLYDVMAQNETCNIDIAQDDGKTYIGLFADMPWNYDYVTREMSLENYTHMLQQYIKLITNDEIPIKYWNVESN